MSLYELPDIVAQLWPFAVGLYLLSGLGWGGGNGVQFTALWGGRFRVGRTPLTITALLPFSLVVAASKRGVLPGETGVYFPKAPANATIPYRTADYDFVPYETLKPLAVEGHWLKAGGEKRFRAQTGGEARRWAQTLATLADCDEGARVERLKGFVRRAGNPRRLSRRLEILHRRTLLIQGLGLMLFLVLFFLLPGVVYGDVTRHVRLGLLLVYVAALSLLLAVLVICKYRKLHRAGMIKTLGALSSPLFYPFLFASPLTHLSRELAAELDFFAIHAALRPREEALIVVQREHYALTHSVETDGEFSRALELRRELLTGVFNRLEATIGERSATLPKELEDNVGSWCPICNGEYLERVGQCPECRVATLERD